MYITDTDHEGMGIVLRAMQDDQAPISRDKLAGALAAIVDRIRPDVEPDLSINDQITVKLNEDGQRLHLNYWRNLQACLPADALLEHPQPTADADGYSRWPLWKFMQVFGPHCHNGSAPPFEGRIGLPTGSDSASMLQRMQDSLQVAKDAVTAAGDAPVTIDESVRIWEFWKAPEEYQKYSENGGDEDWIILSTAGDTGTLRETADRLAVSEADFYALPNGHWIAITNHA